MNPTMPALRLHQSAGARSPRTYARPQIKISGLLTLLAQEVGDNMPRHLTSVPRGPLAVSGDDMSRLQLLFGRTATADRQKDRVGVVGRVHCPHTETDVAPTANRSPPR